MNCFRKHTVFALALAALCTGNAAAQVQVFAQVDSQKDIYVGESFTYYIIITGSDKAGQVDLTALNKFNPQHTGNRQQSSTQIINNRVTTSQNIIMTYSLTSGSAGQINLPSVDVTLDGKNYKTNPVEVNILKPGTTDQLDLEVTLSEEQCYVGQPVLMTISFYFSADISDPQFNIPVFNSDAFYFENPDIPDQRVKEVDLGSGITVLLSQHRVNHKGKQCNLFVLRKILIPRTFGSIQIDSTTVSTNVVVGQSRLPDRFFDDFFSSRKKYKRFMVTSKPLTLNVLRLPEEGKPEGFYGLVGQYTISASARPTKVNVGDPITLTIRVGDGRYLKPVQWPALEQIPEMADNFKIPSEKASPIIENGQKIFTQTIRAGNDRISEIPAIPLAYFNVDKGEYDTARSEPIKLEVSPTKILTQADLEGRESDFQPINKEVEAIKKGLSANYESPEVLENMIFSPTGALISPVYAPVWAVPLIILLFSFAAKLFTHASPEKAAAKRRRQACGKAISQMKKISSMDSAQRNERIMSIMKQYIGDRFDKTAGSLTANDCYEIIINATDDDEIADTYRRIMERCESSRYASIDVNIDFAKTKDIIELIHKIEKKSKK